MFPYGTQIVLFLMVNALVAINSNTNMFWGANKRYHIKTKLHNNDDEDDIILLI